MLANRNSSVTHNCVDYVQGDRFDSSGIGRLATAIHRLADVLEATVAMGLGGEHKPRYKAAPKSDSGLVNEAAMAAQLGIPAKTLADYRREGRLAKCWIRNGKRVLWRQSETLAAWERGIS